MPRTHIATLRFASSFTDSYFILIFFFYLFSLPHSLALFISQNEQQTHRKKAGLNMDGQFLIRQIYDDEITYNLITVAVEILSEFNCVYIIIINFSAICRAYFP